MRDALIAQDGLYSVLSRGREGADIRVIGSIVKYLLAPDDPEAVLEQMAAASTHIVSLTITEKGYCAKDLSAKQLDADHPFVVHDAANPGQPRSALGFVVAALARRRAAGMPPFVVLSCDNLPANGTTARALTLSMAAQMAAGLGVEGSGFLEWVASEVRFPNTMVDRITPATTDEVRAATRRHGIDDAWPVAAEDFIQWVIEDDFPQGRPRWESAAPLGPSSAALLVQDVVPFELMKLRLLNGGHSALAYLAYLLGHRTTDAAMDDADVARFVRAYMAEVMPRVPPVPGVDLPAYQARLLERFANPAIGDAIQRLCEDGSQKMTVFIAPPTRESIGLGVATPCAAFATATWIQYRTALDCEGNAIPITDPGAATTLEPLAREAAAAPNTDTVRAFVHAALGTTLSESAAFVGDVAAALAALKACGPREALRAFLAAR